MLFVIGVLWSVSLASGPALAVAAKPAPAAPAVAAGGGDLARALGNTFANVAERVSPSVVVITVTRGGNSAEDGIGDDAPNPFDNFYRGPRRMPLPRDTEPSRGSGFIVRSDGYILTNCHVVQGAAKIKVKLKDGRTFDAQLVGIPDEKTDVAVVKIEAKDLPKVEFGDSDAIRPGEWTIAIGAPFNLDYSVTVGVLSGKVRDGLHATMYEEYLQTQATINPGNSGGPLLDIEGRVIGVNTLIKTRPGTGFSFYNANVGFAIPIKLASKICALLITKGKVERPWLGVGISTLDETPSEDMNLIKGAIQGVSKGVLIKSINPDTPAYRSGLKPADIITAIDGTPVGTARELQAQVLEKKIGQTVRLSIMRHGVPSTIEVKTGLQPSTQQIASRVMPPQTPPATSTYGMALQPLTRELIEQFKLTEKQGLLIVDLEEDSAAARCGLTPGTVITEVDGKEILSIQALRSALRKANSKTGSLLQISRDGTRSFVILRQDPGGVDEHE